MRFSLKILFDSYITVVKDEFYRDLAPTNFVRFGAIAMAGLSNPTLTQTNTLKPCDYELTKKKSKQYLNLLF